MTNHYHILAGKAPLDLIDVVATDPDSAVMLYAGGNDSGVYPKAPQDFDLSRHLMLMSAYWRQAQACPEQASPIADTALNSPEAYYTPESWLKYRKL